ncbi:MAG: multicopper oxidase family protein [Candidatus Eremiobacteraeota bacterium]|nr:multicopper oxidase family protein [Candidatus Eremiobacteraeota bacterium]
MSAFALPALPPRARASATHEVTLESSPLRFSPLPGTSFAALGYNGRIPGPVIRLQAGQRLRCRYVNRTPYPSTIHWHGVVLPNAMDGVENLTQAPVPPGGAFLYDFVPQNTGTKWYHDHIGTGLMRGLFGILAIDDPRDERADVDLAVVFHDVPELRTVDAAMMGVSKAPMVDPLGSSELREMAPDDKMGDEVAYVAHCVNGGSYPHNPPIVVKVGQIVRLRVLNANPTQTRYVRLAAHRLRVTHGDGNALETPVEVEALRVGVGERYDAWFEVRKPGAWLLQGLSADPAAFAQAVVIRTEGMENVSPASESESLEGVSAFDYRVAGEAIAEPARLGAPDVAQHFTLAGGKYGSNRWTIDGAVWPHTPKVRVRRNDRVVLRFTNKTDMDHPLHLHGHDFSILEIDAHRLRKPLVKDTSLVRANGGTIAWSFRATSPSGRWLLHCHNQIHMMDGMMTELIYLD